MGPLRRRRNRGAGVRGLLPPAVGDGSGPGGRRGHGRRRRGAPPSSVPVGTVVAVDDVVVVEPEPVFEDLLGHGASSWSWSSTTRCVVPSTCWAWVICCSIAWRSDLERGEIARLQGGEGVRVVRLAPAGSRHRGRHGPARGDTALRRHGHGRLEQVAEHGRERRCRSSRSCPARRRRRRAAAAGWWSRHVERAQVDHGIGDRAP